MALKLGHEGGAGLGFIIREGGNRQKGIMVTISILRKHNQEHMPKKVWSPGPGDHNVRSHTGGIILCCTANSKVLIYFTIACSCSKWTYNFRSSNPSPFLLGHIQVIHIHRHMLLSVYKRLGHLISKRSLNTNTQACLTTTLIREQVNMPLHFLDFVNSFAVWSFRWCSL